MAAVLKTVRSEGLVGSNPTASEEKLIMDRSRLSFALGLCRAILWTVEKERRFSRADYRRLKTVDKIIQEVCYENR